MRFCLAFSSSSRFSSSSLRRSGDAAHASGWKGMRDAEANGGFGLSTALGSPLRSGSRGFRRLRPYVKF